MFKAESNFSVESTVGKCIVGPHHGPDGKRIGSESGTQPYSEVSQPQINAGGWGITDRGCVNAPFVEDSEQAFATVIVKRPIC